MASVFLGEEEGPDEADLWFLPGPSDEAERLPWVEAPRSRLVDIAAWRAAEAALVQELCELAGNTGRLVERAAAMGQGAVARLAHAEAEAIGWWAGHRIGGDRIALFLSWRVGATGEAAAGLIRLGWAARRLMAAGSGDRAGQLGLTGAARDLAIDVDAALPGPGELGPVAVGCLAFHLWRMLDERPEEGRGIEAAVLGARLGVGGEGGLGFLPLCLAGAGGLMAAGDPERRLRAWVAGANNSVLAALMLLDRLRRWRARAVAATADLQGRTPGRLIEALLAQPMISVPELVRETGVSRPAVGRNLAILAERGLVREVTGQGRFRVWAARV